METPSKIGNLKPKKVLTKIVKNDFKNIEGSGIFDFLNEPLMNNLANHVPVESYNNPKTTRVIAALEDDTN